MKKKEERVILEMTREQANIVEKACELLARLHIGQFDMIIDACIMDYKSVDYCKHRDLAKPILDEAAKAVYGVNIYGRPNVRRDDVHLRAWSVYQTLRYTRSWHDHPEGNPYSVCFDPPMAVLDEPLPKCQIVKKDAVNSKGGKADGKQSS